MGRRMPPTLIGTRRVRVQNAERPWLLATDGQERYQRNGK